MRDEARTTRPHAQISDGSTPKPEVQISERAPRVSINLLLAVHRAFRRPGVTRKFSEELRYPQVTQSVVPAPNRPAKSAVACAVAG
jgi:hypothetical protein